MSNETMGKLRPDTRRKSSTSSFNYNISSGSVHQLQHHDTTHPSNEPRTQGAVDAWAPSSVLPEDTLSPYHQHLQHIHASTSDPTSPALYSPPTTAISAPGGQSQLFYPSPYLHHTQRQPVKETHLLDIDFDPISGRKVINHYEIIDEIGRGVHGKVKLGRDLLNDGQYVAIKIIIRNDRPRLGKLGPRKSDKEEKVRREIAILKKCRHENVVRLIEVIDDPQSKKVFLVLEYVDLGEIIWRRLGDEKIVKKEAKRVETLRRLALGEPLPVEDPEDVARRKIRRKRRREKQRLQREEAKIKGKKRQSEVNTDHIWSLELQGETDDDHYEESEYDSIDDQDPDITPQVDDLLSSIPRNLSFSTTTTSTTDNIESDYLYVPALSINQARAAFRDTVLGLEYLHYQGIIHRDIKPANLLWSREHRVKISDFGVSYLESGLAEEGVRNPLQSDLELAKTVGTPAFFAPELCFTDFTNPLSNRPKITNAIDIWALGVTLYCLIFARCPFMADNEFELFRVIAKQPLYIPETRLRTELAASPAGSRPNSTRRSESYKKSIQHDLSVAQDSTDTIHEYISPELRDLLERLLQKDASKRITLADVKRHPWVLSELDDPISWIEESDPQNSVKLEVSKEEMEEAVVPASVLNRVKNSIKKVMDEFVGVVGLRRRAHSAAQIPSGSFTPSVSTVSQFDAALHASSEGLPIDHDKYSESEAEKSLKKRRSSLAVRPSPLRRTVSGADTSTHLIPPTSAPKPVPTTPLNPSTPIAQAYDTPSRLSKSSNIGHYFVHRNGLNKSSKTRTPDDSTSEPASGTDNIEPGDVDIEWADIRLGKEQKHPKRSTSLRGWGSALRRGSKQSCESIMRLAAGFADSKSSRSASPMPSGPTSPSDETRSMFSDVAPLPSPTAQIDHFRRTTSPFGLRSHNSFVPLIEEDSFPSPCPSSPDDYPTAMYLSNMHSRSMADNSSVSNSTVKPSASSTSGSIFWNPNNDTPPEVLFSPHVSPRTASILPPQSRFHRGSAPLPHDTGHPDRSAVCSSSSEDQSAVSSLTNSTSFPSVLSASSSLSNHDDQWLRNYGTRPSPKTQAGTTTEVPLEQRLRLIAEQNPRTPQFFVGGDDDEDEDNEHEITVEADDVDDEDCEDEDDEEEEEEGLLLDLRTKKKDYDHALSSSSVASPTLTGQVRSEPISRQRTPLERVDTIVR